MINDKIEDKTMFIYMTEIDDIQNKVTTRRVILDLRGSSCVYPKEHGINHQVSLIKSVENPIPLDYHYPTP
jgi:hypothetical protein